MSKSKQDYTYVDANVKLSLGERLNYALGDFGYNFIYYWISAYMMIFLTDSVGIAAGAVSTLVLVMRLYGRSNQEQMGTLPPVDSDWRNCSWYFRSPYVCSKSQLEQWDKACVYVGNVSDCDCGVYLL